MYSDIKTAIKTHIEAITGIQVVYGYEKGELAGYPAAIITCEGIESIIESTYQNERKYTFKIKIYQEMVDEATGAQTAEGVIEALIDSVIAKFETDYDLGGLCHRVDIKGIMGYADRGTALRVLEMTLDCYSLKTI